MKCDLRIPSDSTRIPQPRQAGYGAPVLASPRALTLAGIVNIAAP